MRLRPRWRCSTSSRAGITHIGDILPLATCRRSPAKSRLQRGQRSQAPDRLRNRDNSTPPFECKHSRAISIAFEFTPRRRVPVPAGKPPIRERLGSSIARKFAHRPFSISERRRTSSNSRRRAFSPPTPRRATSEVANWRPCDRGSAECRSEIFRDSLACPNGGYANTGRDRGGPRWEGLRRSRRRSFECSTVRKSLKGGAPAGALHATWVILPQKSGIAPRIRTGIR